MAEVKNESPLASANFWGGLALIAVVVMFGLYMLKPNPPPQPNPFNPWSPSPYVNPVNPPAPYHPCPDCHTLKGKVEQERAAVRRELARAQLNIQQLQTRSGVAAMRIPDWLYYTDTGATVKEKMTWGSEPTPAPGGVIEAAPPPEEDK